MADIRSEKDVGFIGPITFLSDLTVGPTYFAKSDLSVIEETLQRCADMVLKMCPTVGHEEHGQIRVFYLPQVYPEHGIMLCKLMFPLSGQKPWLGILTFLCPVSNNQGHIVFALLVCLFVVNINIRYNFWNGMYTQLIMPFQMTPRSMSMTLWPWHWPLC